MITEGNYLLLDAPPWDVVRKHLAGLVLRGRYDLRRKPQVARHIAFGKAPDHAAGRVATVDEPKARLVAATRDRADLVVDVATI